MSIFGWSLPPGCTLNDIDDLCGEHGPECLGDPPELSEEEVAKLEMQEAWSELQSVPSYVERCKIDERALAEVATFYPNYTPDYVRDRLNDYLANDEGFRWLVVQYREALQK